MVSVSGLTSDYKTEVVNCAYFEAKNVSEFKILELGLNCRTLLYKIQQTKYPLLDTPGI